MNTKTWMLKVFFLLVFTSNNAFSNVSIGDNFAVYNKKLYFVADNSQVGDELYVYDEATGETNLVIDLNLGEEGSAIEELIVYNDKLYFSAFGNQLYVYDDVINQALLISDFSYENFSPFNGTASGPTNFTLYNNKLYFSAQSHPNGSQLHSYDSTVDELVLVLPAFSHYSGAIIPSVTVYDEQFFLSYYERNHGISYLRVYDDSSGDFLSVNETSNGIDVSNVGNLALFDNKLYFSANSEEYQADTQLYSYEGNFDQISLASDISISYSSYLTTYQDKLFFSASDERYGVELHVYDSITGITDLVGDLNNGFESSNPADLIVFNHQLYFSADDGLLGRKLYRYNSISANVELVADDFNGDLPNDPSSITILNDHLYFKANNDSSGDKIFRYDETDGQIIVVIESDTLSQQPAAPVEDSSIDTNDKSSAGGGGLGFLLVWLTIIFCIKQRKLYVVL